MDMAGSVIHLSCTHQPDDDRIYYREVLSLQKQYSPIEVIGVAPESRNEVREGIGLTSVEDRGFQANIRQITDVMAERRPLLLHVHDLFMMRAALDYGRRRGIPVIYDAHEDYPLLVSSYLKGFLRRAAHSMYWRREERIAVSRADAVITVVPHLTRKFAETAQRIAEIRNYPRPGLFDSRDERREAAIERRLPERKPGELRIAYVGNIGRIRNLKLLAETVEELNRRGFACRAVTAGGGEAEEVRQWEGYSGKNPDTMTYLGRLEHPDVPHLLRRCDLGWCVLPDIPLYRMSLPNKFAEYLACGLPAIISDFEPLRHLFQTDHSPGLIIKSASAEEAALAVEERFSAPDSLERASQDGLQIVRTEASWEHEEGKLLTLYGELLNNA